MLLNIDPSAEKQRITSFIKSVLKKQGFEKVVIGLSGGVDSATAFYLLRKVLPPENIFVAHLYYFESQIKDIDPILREARIPKENIYEISIAPIVKAFQQALPSRHSGKPKAHPESPTAIDAGQASMTNNDRVRLGNIMARVRMIALF